MYIPRQMPGGLRITVVNAAYDPSLPDCDDLLERYETLTDWCDALSDAGADVHVVQRFAADAVRRRGSTDFTFVADGAPPTPPPTAGLRRLVDAVSASRPALVHVNGLGFPALVSALRVAVALSTPLAVQDHAGVRVPNGRGPLAAWRRARWRSGLSAADAISFSAVDQAQPWRDAGIIADQRVLALIESSTRMQPSPRDQAIARIGVSGRPLVLWVGRLVRNKDPLTVLAAFEEVVRRHPSAHLAMVFHDGTLERDVRDTIGASSLLRSSVTLVGSVSHDAMAHWYSAADVFLSGSHAEGSGYALIESMACGLVPVVTAIPSFQAIAGSCGLFWPPEDAAACASALSSLCDRDLASARSAVRGRFRGELSWKVIGDRTLTAYRSLVADRAQKAASR
ncbi:MAG TPA: glycosyltransferase family 4 protein [Vicinamibacterales bacterium]|jgi:glycosyltransferase involved in cell wall biosynthesis|nr:glycosyltransferase family 4 protein [Vicinamibacterales bacterium]